jgi:hypothetical protein
MLHLVKTHYGEQNILSQILFFKLYLSFHEVNMNFFFINYIQNKVIQNPKNKIVEINYTFID